jgi:hypothetical protein
MVLWDIVNIVLDIRRLKLRGFSRWFFFAALVSMAYMVMFNCAITMATLSVTTFNLISIFIAFTAPIVYGADGYFVSELCDGL